MTEIGVETLDRSTITPERCTRIRADCRIQDARFDGMSSSSISDATPRRPGLFAEFEFVRCLGFVGCSILVNKAKSKLDAMLSKDITHRTNRYTNTARR